MTMQPLALFTAVAAAALPLGAHAEATIRLDDFSDCSTLQLNGDATCVDGALRLTPAASNRVGSAFPLLPVALGANAAFSTRFSFDLNDGGGPFVDDSGVGADGFVFVLQPASAQALGIGGGGGGLGYFEIDHSLGIEFDTFTLGTSGPDPDGNHIGIDLDGSLISVQTASVAEAPLNDGNVWFAWVDYDGQTLQVRLGQTAVRPAVPRLDMALDLAAVLESTTVFAGFTAATGSSYENHDILDWTFDDAYSPGDGDRIFTDGFDPP